MAKVGGLKQVSTGRPGADGFVPSPQQAAALDFVVNGSGSAVLEAVAGAGKTTTLVQICKRIRGRAVFTAFNKKIADEIGRKLAESGIDSRQVRSATFHAIGFAAWRKVAPRVRVDGDKLDNIMHELDVPKPWRGFVRALTSLGKQSLVGLYWKESDLQEWEALVDHHDLAEKLAGDDEVGVPSSRLHDAISWAVKVLGESNARAEQVIDFDDMIFVPLLRGANFDKYDWVLVDEAQDTNRARRAMARAMLATGGRLIAVGDRHQAIYGFTGADSDALDLIAEDFGCIDLPLTVTYRCPKAVVTFAQRWVSHIQAHESAPEGVVDRISEPVFKREMARFLRPEDAILCRNTKPLVELAFDLLRKRVGCHVEGRDIGQGLLTLVRKWKSPRNCGQLRDQLRDYLESEINKLLAKNQEHKIDAVKDKVETLFVMIDHAGDDAPLFELESLINSMFKDTAGNDRSTVTLSTVHKAKGREWSRVFLYGRNRYMPSPFAKQPWQVEQEKNLIYVAVTRAKSELIEVEVAMPNEPGPTSPHIPECLRPKDKPVEEVLPFPTPSGLVIPKVGDYPREVQEAIAAAEGEAYTQPPAPRAKPMEVPAYVHSGVEELVQSIMLMKKVDRPTAIAILRTAAHAAK